MASDQQPRSREIVLSYVAYDEHPLDEPDVWGALASFREAVAVSRPILVVMIPVVTPEEMAAIDAAAPEPVEVLIGRAGAAVARAAVEMLGGTYGRRVVVVAGKGNNGNDGRDAAARLARRGVRVQVIPARDAPRDLPAADLVIDAAYGTGFHGEHRASHPTALADRHGSVPQVLAVDIPSGVSGLTGKASGTPLVANRTVSFAALKPGLVLHPGRELAGEVTVADIGLDVSSSTAGLVEEADVARWLPRRDVNDHKWSSGLLVMAGSAGMLGAASLVIAAAQRAGAGMVRYLVPGAPAGIGDRMPTEAVAVAPSPGPAGGESLPDTVGTILAQRTGRIRALVIGPGLGTSQDTMDGIRQVLAGPARELPVVVDADGLTALGEDAASLLHGRTVPAVLTPHDGEYARLTGARPGPDRGAEVRQLAEQTGAVVLLKGSTTVVAHPDGRLRFVTSGDQRLATAGTGDVLSGAIGAFLARGADPFNAAAAAAWVHGQAGSQGPETGLIASDLLRALPHVLSQLEGW